MSFKYSAMNPAASVSTSASSTGMPTVLAKVMARPCGRYMLTPGRPRQPSTRQASNSESDSENSAARCRVFQRQKPKLRKNKKLCKAKSHTQARDSVSFHYSAMNSAADVSTSATGTGRQPVSAKQIYRSNTAVVGIGKKGSHLYYLDRKIKLLKSKIASYIYNLVREITRVCSKVDLYSHELFREIKLLNSKIDSYAHDLNKRVKQVHSKIYSYVRDLDWEVQLLNLKIDSYTRISGKSIEKLNSNVVPYADDTGKEINMLNSKTASYTKELDSSIRLLNHKLDSYDQALERETILLKSKTYNLF